MDKKKFLDRLYKARVSNTFDMKTIYYLKKLLNNTLDRKETILYLQNFVEEEQKYFYITEEQTIKAREYFVKKYLSKDKQKIRINKDIYLHNYNLLYLKNYYKDMRFLFLGFVKIKSWYSIEANYEPVYRVILEDKKGYYHLDFDYFHFNGKDFEVDLYEEKIVKIDRFSKEDEKIYIDGVIYLWLLQFILLIIEYLLIQ